MRLVGYINGMEVSFDFYPPSSYKANIPKHLEGSYIVQLKAIDDAGNEANYTDILVYFDFQKMEFMILNYNYSHEIIVNTNYSVKSIESNFTYKEVV